MRPCHLLTFKTLVTYIYKLNEVFIMKIKETIALYDLGLQHRICMCVTVCKQQIAILCQTPINQSILCQQYVYTDYTFLWFL